MKEGRGSPQRDFTELDRSVLTGRARLTSATWRATSTQAMHALVVALAFVTILISCSTAPPPQLTVARLAELQSLVDSGGELPRPRLPPGVDTNAAAAYYHWGEPLVRFGVKLDSAEMALYWASRLDPAWPDPIYARAVAILGALRHDAFETWLRTRSTRAVRRVGLAPRQVQLVDSLQRIAWARNPFLFTDLEFHRLAPGRPGDPVRDAWLAFASRRFVAAESLFALALRKHPDDVGLRIYRARALFYLGKWDQTVGELEVARDTLRAWAQAKLAVLLPSVEMFEYAIGIARVQQDDFPAARAAFERALTANLGFYWAHARLAGAALALGDTAAALAELDLAVQLEDHDPVLRLYDGAVLRAAGRLEEAGVQLRKAIELDPYYATPYFWLAALYAAQGKVPGAIEQYRMFSAHAAQADSNRARADRALAALGAALPAPAGVDSGHVPRHF